LALESKSERVCVTRPACGTNSKERKPVSVQVAREPAAAPAAGEAGRFARILAATSAAVSVAAGVAEPKHPTRLPDAGLIPPPPTASTTPTIA